MASARWPLRELDDRNSADAATKSKICSFCKSPTLVHMSRTALTDLGLIPLSKEAMLGGVIEHIESHGRVFTDRMDNGDTAYFVKECIVEDGVILYVKMRFFQLEADEGMLVFSAHPPRRWC